MSKKVQEKKPPQEPLYSVEVKFERSSATYKPQEFVTGSLSVCKRNMVNFSVQVQHIKMTVTGKSRIQNRQNKPIIEELIRQAPKIQIYSELIQLSQQKTINHTTVLPFKFKLSKQPGMDQYLESYIGVFLSVIYQLVFDIKFTDPTVERLKTQMPFYVQVPNAGREMIPNFQYPKPKFFVIRSEDIKNQQAKTHKFQIRGELASEIIYFADYLEGKFTIDFSESPIRSIDLQMLRNEKIDHPGKVFNEVTEIQLIQLCDGDVTRNMELPIFMILPRYYSCPSIKYKWLHLTFEINLVIGFKDGYKVTANIPLKLIRN